MAKEKVVDHRPLVLFLRTNGNMGRAKPIGRANIARAMHASVREVQAMAEASRNRGVPDEIVSYTSAGKEKGMFLAANNDEVKELQEKILREAKARLRQCRGLREAMRKQMPNVFDPPPENMKQMELLDGKKEEAGPSAAAQ